MDTKNRGIMAGFVALENGGQCIKDLLDGKKRAFERNYLRYIRVAKNSNG